MLLGPTIVGLGGWRRAHCLRIGTSLDGEIGRSEIEKRARHTELTVETGTERDCRLGEATASSSQDGGSATDPCDDIENVDG